MLSDQWRGLRRAATFVAVDLGARHLRLAVEAHRAAVRLGDRGHGLRRVPLPRRDGPHLPQVHPVAEPVRDGRHRAARGGRRQPAPRVVLAPEVPLDRGHRVRVRRRLVHRADLRAPHDPVGDRGARLARRRAGRTQPAVPHPLHPAAALLPVQLPDLHGADDADGDLADPGLRAGRCEVGRQARRRARPGRGEGRGAPDRQPLAVRRGVREGGRQARARPALPRRPRHRQDDAREGDRDWVQLTVRLHPRLGLRADLHRHRRADRALHGAEGEEARRQVGRPVHRLHRRDRRRRHAPRVARRRRGR